jgi:Domain of unknown function (DUF4062)
MDKVYQVFVSSTYSDLKAERRGVSETLAKAGYIPAGMELFPAADQQQLEFIKRAIDRCDYYVVIVGGRYGSLADDKISFTEKEYEYAISRQIPILAFLHGQPEKIEVGKTDRDETQAKRLEAFRERLAAGRVVDFWSDPQELCTKIVIAVTQATNLSPGLGWIRGDQAIDPKVLQDMERLRLENADLRKQLHKNESTVELSFPRHLASPYDKFDFPILEDGTKKEFLISETWQKVFLRGGHQMQLESPEDKIVSAIIRGLVRHHKPEEYSESAQYSFKEPFKVKFHLEALGLIRVTSKGSYPNAFLTWILTEKGRRMLAEFLAVKKSNKKPKAPRKKR